MNKTMDNALKEKLVSIKVNELKSENNTAKQIFHVNEGNLQKAILGLTVMNTVGIGVLFYLL